jgi:hypothetical protein
MGQVEGKENERRKRNTGREKKKKMKKQAEKGNKIEVKEKYEN